jgi:16S rRNA (cytosine1402-N4)-methyltransferase
MHYAVQAHEAIEFLAVKPEGIYIDATCGLGGHTARIAQRLGTGFVVANDRDPDSLEMARRNTAAWAGRIRFHYGRFSQLDRIPENFSTGKVDGVLADLGVSRYQLTEPDRGFSLLNDGPLDMRMDKTTGITAADLVNETAEKALADLIYQQGEERRARRIARAISEARPIRSTLHLAGVVERAVPRKGQRLHPATQTFLALRRAVNNEDKELDSLLEKGPELLRAGGRLVLISFMSLEDRKVKQRFRELAQAGRAAILTRRPLEPTDEEVRENPASRSAKLRALEML